MNLIHLIPDVVYSVWLYHQPKKDGAKVLPGRVSWEELCASYFTWGHSRISEEIEFPSPVIDALFDEVELYPGIRCSNLAATVIRSEFALNLVSAEAARKALGWYYLFRIKTYGEQFDFLWVREVALTSKLASINSCGAPALELVSRVQAFAQDYDDLRPIAGDPLVILGWLFVEKKDPFFAEYWLANAEFFLSDRANSLFNVPDGVPLIVSCVEQYRQRVSQDAVHYPLDWRGQWLRLAAPNIVKQCGGFLLRGGVNLIGAAHAESGIGEDVRLFAEVLTEIGIPFIIVSFPKEILSPTTNEELVGQLGDYLLYDVSLLCLPPEELLHLRHAMGKACYAARYNIGYFPVELAKFPVQLKPSLDLIQEAWCMSEFVRVGLPANFAKPTELMPAVVSPGQLDPEIDRESLALPGDRFIFLCCFDALSYLHRKNPIGAVNAFVDAFGLSDDVCLVIKTMNLSGAPAEFVKQLKSMTGASSNIILINEVYSKAKTQALIANADALVSLHRSEGFGRVLAEAMYYGVPVIASGYSGSLDFADAETAFLVDGVEIPVPEGAYPYGAGNKWFEPSATSASEQMRRVFHMRRTRELREIVDRGRGRIIERHGIRAAAARLNARLAIIRNLQDISPQRRNLIFDSGFYGGMSPDLPTDASPFELFRHYAEYGLNEGRAGSRPLFEERHRHERNGRERNERLVVVIHCYYTEQIRGLARYLENLDFIDYDLYVNLVSRVGAEDDAAFVRKVLPKATVFFGENRGRDIGGLLNVLRRIERRRYDLCLVLHTKSSPQNKGVYASVWRDDLIGCLLRDPMTAYRNIASFSRAGSRVGAVGALNWRSESLCGNAEHVSKLFARFGIQGDDRKLEYISGSMMFIRMSVLDKLAAAISFEEFELCDGKPKEFFIDAQLEHAIERVLGSLIRDAGLTIEWVQ